MNRLTLCDRRTKTWALKGLHILTPPCSRPHGLPHCGDSAVGVQVFTTGYRFSDKRHVTGCACRKDPCHSTIPYTGDLEVGVTVLGVRICIYVLGVLYLGQGHGIAWGGRYVTGQTRVGPGARHWAGCGNVTRYVTEAGGGRSCGT